MPPIYQYRLILPFEDGKMVQVSTDAEFNAVDAELKLPIDERKSFKANLSVRHSVVEQLHRYLTGRTSRNRLASSRRCRALRRARAQRRLLHDAGRSVAKEHRYQAVGLFHAGRAPDARPGWYRALPAQEPGLLAGLRRYLEQRRTQSDTAVGERGKSRMILPTLSAMLRYRTLYLLAQ